MAMFSFHSIPLPIRENALWLLQLELETGVLAVRSFQASVASQPRLIWYDSYTIKRIRHITKFS
jgi:hypothetical protein